MAAYSHLPQRVFILDDCPIVRLGLRRIIDESRDIVICGEAESSEAAVTGICSTQATVAIVELVIASRDRGLGLLHRIFAVRPQLPVLILSSQEAPRTALQALCAGARGYLCKDEPVPEIRHALETVLAGGRYVGRRFRSRAIFQILGDKECEVGAALRRLTRREMELFEALGSNEPLASIAAAMGLSVKTIETHRSHIVDKLGLRDSATLLEFATDWRHYQSSDCENLRAA